MDLGIAGKWALVCGASKGLGLGCAQALHAEGVNDGVSDVRPGCLFGRAHQLGDLRIRPVQHVPVHHRDPFAKDRGEIVGGYCVAKLAAGDYLTETMTLDELERGIRLALITAVQTTTDEKVAGGSLH